MTMPSASSVANLMMQDNGIDPTTASTKDRTFYNSIATQIQAMITKATVLPVGVVPPATTPTPTLLSGAPGSPVTGFGSIA